MDSFTQAALGATVAQAAFGRRLGRKALWAGALLGALPDVDIISAAWGPWASMVHHRGLTHSLLFAPVAAPLLGWAAWRLAKRKDEPWRWMHLAFWALITHPLLDWFTSYGTQLLWPLTDRRFALDAVSIVDPIYSLTLVGALLGGWWWRRQPRRAQRSAVAALALSTGYLLWGWSESHEAQRLAEAQLKAEGFAPTHVRAQPSLLIWMWRVAAKNSEGDLRVGAVSTFRPTPIRFVSLERPEDPRVVLALASERGRLFDWFADGMVGVRIESRDDGARVYLDDQRYGLVTEPGVAFWGAVADFDTAGRLVTIDRYNARPAGKLSEALGASWRMMLHGADRVEQLGTSAALHRSTRPRAATGAEDVRGGLGAGDAFALLVPAWAA